MNAPKIRFDNNFLSEYTDLNCEKIVVDEWPNLESVTLSIDDEI
jgi:hypothetical protein